MLMGFGCKISQLSHLELKAQIWESGHGVEAGKEFFRCCWMGRGLCRQCQLNFPLFFPGLRGQSVGHAGDRLQRSSHPCGAKQRPTHWVINSFPLQVSANSLALGLDGSGSEGGFYLVNKSPRHLSSSSSQGSGLHFWLLFVTQRQFSLLGVTELDNVG